MNIVHLSHTDSGAGAGHAAYRLHKSILKLGINSSMLVADKRTDDPTVSGLNRSIFSRTRLYEWLESRHSRLLARTPHSLFSPARFVQYNPASHPNVLSADVVTLYWINGGFISPETITHIAKPLVWRLSDIWPFSGGCHYPGDCEGYTKYCGNCPQVKHPSKDDFSRRLWKRKFNAWQNINFTITAPSSWMAKLARQSSLFKDCRIEVIPTGVDLALFRPLDKPSIRERLGIPTDSLVIAFSSLDPNGDRRKGYFELSVVLQCIASSSLSNRVMALIFGREKLSHEFLPIETRYLGRLGQDQNLVDAYSVADVVVVPSIEDNLPNVALEAIACGTPVCAFEVGGMADIIRDAWNGFLSPVSDSVALAENLISILSNEDLRRQMAKNARAHAERVFSLDLQASSYIKLYAELKGKRVQ